ncbi:MAG: hypothetical protein PGN25_08360 [Methylorubrum populi]
MNPLQILKNAQNEVPSLRFASGLVGIAAAGTIIVSLMSKNGDPYILAGSVLVGMAVLFIFSVAVTSGVIGGGYAASALIWSINLFFITFLFFTVFAFSSGLPCNWAKFIRVDAAQQCNGYRRYSSGDQDPVRNERSQEVSAFTYDAQVGSGQSAQRWQRLSDDQWIETYPSSNPQSPNYFKRIKRISYSGCDGVVLSKIGDNEFQILIPDKDCPNKGIKFRTSPDQKWIGLPSMYNII